MSQERKANLAQSTLNGSITDVATTLTVTSAASFPTLPQFRCKLEDELVLVTGVSGAVFTITREIEGTTKVAHGDSVTITLIETEAGQVQFQRDWSNPLWGVGKPMQLLDSAGATLTASSFANINFTNASKSDVTGGAIVLEHDTQSAANDIAIIKKAAPTPPWVLTVGFIPNLLKLVGTAVPSCGPVVRDGTTGELYNMQISTSTAGGVDGVKSLTPKFASPTSAATSFLAFDIWSGIGGVIWYRIEDNNTNLIFSYSADSVNYVVMGQEARTTFLTPDEIGFAINNFSNTTIKAQATIVAWDES